MSAGREGLETSGYKAMTVKDFPTIHTRETQDPPHRAMSRAPASHNVTLAILGVVCVVAVFGVLWLLYAFG